MNVLHELRELDAYLEGMEDIDQDGGPNTAMRVRTLLVEVMPKLERLAESSARTIRAFEALGRASVPGTHRECEAAMLAQAAAVASFNGSEVK